MYYPYILKSEDPYDPNTDYDPPYELTHVEDIELD